MYVKLFYILAQKLILRKHGLKALKKHIEPRRTH